MTWTSRPWACAAAILAGLTACETDQAHVIRKTARNVQDVTGAHTRVVWVQDTTSRADVFARGSELRLMAYDSRDGQGERILLAGPANFSKPLFMDSGDRVVFTDHDDLTVHMVHWDGSGRRQLTDGKALDVWTDPETGVEWVYVGSNPANTRAPSYHQVHRHPIDDPEQREFVWDGELTGEDSFQLSADGRMAGGSFPWPHCGVVDLHEQTFTRLGNGCWTSLSPDDSYLFWIFDGAHRNLTLWNVRTDMRWTVNLSQAPGIDGYESYHPRWSNHPRFMTLTGPYKIRGGGNNIRGGGADVEVHIGRFSRDFQRIEEWVQVTSNDWANFFPDVWIADEIDDTLLQQGEPDKQHREEGTAPELTEATVQARLTQKSTLPTPEAIAPYTGGLVAHEYRVESVLKGTLDESEILIAHWVIRNGAKLDMEERQEGSVYTLRIAPYDARPELEGERLTIDVDNLLLTTYYELDS